MWWSVFCNGHGKDSGKKTGVTLVFLVPLTLVIRRLTGIRLGGCPKLHQLSCCWFAIVPSTVMVLEERAFVSLENSQVSGWSCCRPVPVTFWKTPAKFLPLECGTRAVWWRRVCVNVLCVLGENVSAVNPATATFRGTVLSVGVFRTGRSPACWGKHRIPVIGAVLWFEISFASCLESNSMCHSPMLQRWPFWGQVDFDAQVPEQPWPEVLADWSLCHALWQDYSVFLWDWYWEPGVSGGFRQLKPHLLIVLQFLLSSSFFFTFFIYIIYVGTSYGQLSLWSWTRAEGSLCCIHAVLYVLMAARSILVQQVFIHVFWPNN